MFLNSISSRLTSIAAAFLMACLGVPLAADTIIVNPGDSIQAAINAAVDGDTVLVMPGSYNELVNFIGKAITLRSSGGPGVTTLFGTGLNNSVVKCISGEGPDTVLEGFTITGGTGDPSVDPRGTAGGGMRNEGSSPTISNCVFIGNDVRGGPAVNAGGGMFNANSNPTVTDCAFIGNQAVRAGGIQNTSSIPTVRNCLFRDNVGGAIGIANPDVTSAIIVNCTFINNDNGAITQIGSASSTVINCLFVGNTHDTSGGALFMDDDARTTVINCTFTENSAPAGMGGAVFIRRAAVLTVMNSVFWNNSSQIDGALGATVMYSDIQGGFPGAGNIDADPQFIDPAGGDYRLSGGSPANDAGDNTAVPAGTTTDLDGNPRFADDSCAPDTGVPDGINPIVDMGAFERPPCVADLTGDCQTDVLDFFVFVGLFGIGDPGADINSDGSINVLDFFAFIVAFAAGCP